MPETQPQLFFVPVRSKMAEILEIAHELWHAYPDIKRWIDEDLDRRARRSKVERLADAIYESEQTLPLPMEEVMALAEAQLDPETLTLEQGRPRTPAVIIYYFLVLRGYFGSISDERSWDRLVDSQTLMYYLQLHEAKQPGRTTIIESLNALSRRTRSRILDLQLEHVLGEELDDFREQTLDSTSIHANSAWPTDIGLIQGFLERAYRIGRNLDYWDLRPFRKWQCPRWFEDLQSAKTAILLSNTRSSKKRRRLFDDFIRIASKLANRLHEEHDEWEALVAQPKLCPSRYTQLQRFWQELGSALSDADILLNYLAAKQEAGKEIDRDEQEKIFSLSDGSAAFIKKGGRDTVFGYKAQLGRSANGFITAVAIPEGNAADSNQLRPMAQQHIERTTIIPDMVSADDGYASGPHADYLQEVLGVADVSISGAKGRRQLGEELWQSEPYKEARADRSAVESLMSVGKHSFRFGQCHRRGIDAVRDELLEKVIAYNFWRIHHERQRQREADEEKRRRRTAA